MAGYDLLHVMSIYRFDVDWLKKKEHKTRDLSKVEADGSLSEKRHLSYADGPSKKDLDFLQKIYGVVSIHKIIHVYV